MMKIDEQFSGGNIEVLAEDGDTVLLEREMRDSIRDWFYWAFRVRGAAGRTVTFRFPSANRVGYYGAAVSRDGEDWRWSGSREVFPDGTEGFTYRFSEAENDILPGVEWNSPAATLETVYFGEPDNPVSIPRLLALGASVAEALSTAVAEGL